MPQALFPMVGRQRELSELCAALDAACEGRGGLWLLDGEPGIGKSRLVEELDRAATARGLPVLWGRCWEAGATPAFWLWTQVLRALARRGASEVRAALDRHARHVFQILPELGEHAAPRTDEDQARFQLLEAVAGTLCDAAQSSPVILMLEDLHAADQSSLAVLEVLAAQARSARLLVVGTCRQAQARRSPGAAALSRLRRSAQVLSLAPLAPDEIREYLEAALGTAVPASLLEAVKRVSEGHPLFMVELVRWLVSQRGASPSGALAVPRSLRALVDERLGLLSPACRDVLGAASVLGREFVAEWLEGLGAWPATQIIEALAEAADAALLVEVSPGEYRFGHALIAEQLYAGLDDASRRSLHVAVADRLAARPGDPAWSEIAYHVLAAGEAYRDRAVEAAICAGERALGLLAFDEAAQWFEHALTALGDRASPERRGEVLLALGHARLRAGDVEAGRRACLEVAELARSQKDAALLGRAALEYGGVFRYGLVEPRLITLLEEALEAQDESDSSLRARLMARLAAARQPATDPWPPIELAREAVAMARRLDDDATLASTMRSACSALMDLADPKERHALNQEYVELARSLGEPAEALRGLMRLVFDRCELGDATGAREAARESERIAGELGSPHAMWPVLGVQAMLADLEGRFDDAERLAEMARQAAARARDPNADTCLTLQRLNRLRLRGRVAEALGLMPEVRRLVGGISFGQHIVAALDAALRIASGRADDSSSRAVADRLDAFLALGDLSLLELAAEAAVALGRAEDAERIYGFLLPQADRFASWGHLGMTVGAPGARVLGLLALSLGRHEDAREHLERALEGAISAGAAPQAAWIALDLASACANLGPRGRERALDRFDWAASEAVRMGMPGLAERAAAQKERLATPGTEPPRPVSERVPEIRLRPDGDDWVVEAAGRSFRVRNSKGIHMLARLLAEPHREFHVLDLVHPEGAAGVDRGDAGDVVDARARDDYRRRATDLRAELEEAHAWNDHARAERLREELEFLEAEMRSALALGGRPRRGRSAAERARINVQRRLRDAIRRIEHHDRDLGRQLDRAVRTGTLCSYDPP